MTSRQHFLTPGGGSTAALSGAMGAALASMVCRITLGKDAYADVHQEIEELLEKTEYLRSRFQQLMQEDIEAYGRSRQKAINCHARRARSENIAQK